MGVAKVVVRGTFEITSWDPFSAEDYAEFQSEIGGNVDVLRPTATSLLTDLLQEAGDTVVIVVDDLAMSYEDSPT